VGRGDAGDLVGQPDAGALVGRGEAGAREDRTDSDSDMAGAESARSPSRASLILAWARTGLFAVRERPEEPAWNPTPGGVATTKHAAARREDTPAMTRLSAPIQQYLSSQPLGRIATVGRDGRPHVVPVSFRYNPDTGTVDVGGHHVATTKKYRDVQATGHAALVVDDIVSFQPWTVRMVEVRGRAEAVPTGGAGLGPGFGDAFIRIHPDKVNAYGVHTAESTT
jgi:pyridoxamine 5'-phosphate oxidase family protein